MPKPKKNKAQNEAVEARVRANQAEQERARGTPGRQTLEAINGVPVNQATGRVATEDRAAAGLRPSADLAPGTPLILQEAAARGLPVEALAPRDQVRNARLVQNLGLQQQDIALQQEIARQNEILGVAPGIADLSAIAGGSLENVPLPAPAATQGATAGGSIESAGPISTAATIGGGVAGGLGVGLPAAVSALGLPVAVTAGAGAIAAAGAISIPEQREKVSIYNTRTKQMPKRMAEIINQANSGMDPNVVLANFQEATDETLQNEANLKAETQNFVTKYLGGPGKEYEDVSNFNKNILPGYARELQEALLNPDPSKIKDLSMYELNTG